MNFKTANPARPDLSGARFCEEERRTKTAGTEGGSGAQIIKYRL